MIDPAQQRREMQETHRKDPHRPQYHFLSPSNWMNDPNGLVRWNGQYHLFYQHNPFAAEWGHIHWGHAVSDDLVHWRDLPLALTPTLGTPDQDGCWSGCAVIDGELVRFFYTGVHPQVVCAATGRDDLRVLEKFDRNPIVAAPPASINAGSLWDFRDPFVWGSDDKWHMILGSRQDGKGGVVLRYSSQDLEHWEYVCPFLEGTVCRETPIVGTMWECPNYFTRNNRHVLLVSILDDHNSDIRCPVYFVGSRRDNRLCPDYQGIVDGGGSFYAPQLLEDDGRVIMFGWLQEARSVAAQKSAGWSGVMSLPRILSVSTDNQLLVSPAPELQKLRSEKTSLKEPCIVDKDIPVVVDTQDDCLEVLVKFDCEQDTLFGMHIRCSPDGEEQTSITYDARRSALIVDCTRSSLDNDTRQNQYSAEVPLFEGRLLILHLFLDRSVLEVFANGAAVISTRIYPTRKDSTGLRLFSQKGVVRVESLDAWHMKPIW